MADCAGPQNSWMSEAPLASKNLCFVFCKCSAESFSLWADCSLTRSLSHISACITPGNLPSLSVSWRGQSDEGLLQEASRRFISVLSESKAFTWADKWRIKQAALLSFFWGEKRVLFIPSLSPSSQKSCPRGTLLLSWERRVHSPGPDPPWQAGKGNWEAPT